MWRMLWSPIDENKIACICLPAKRKQKQQVIKACVDSICYKLDTPSYMFDFQLSDDNNYKI